MRNFIEKVIHWMETYTFSSDYRSDSVVIEKIYRKYAKRIEAEDPSKYLWRAICQYQCQNTARPKVASFIANIVALVCLPFMLLFIRRQKHQSKMQCKYLKVNFHMAYKIPIAIRLCTVEENITEKYLTGSDFYFAMSLFLRHGAFYPELLFKFLRWIASIRPYLNVYQPEYLIQYCEFSSHSSLRKLFLQKQNIKIANVAHGEIFISCRSAFSSFDQYFDWVITPRSMHDAMHIEYKDHFSFNPCEGLPPAPSVEKPVLGFLWPTVEIADLNMIVDRLNGISKFCAVLVRPHPNPRYAKYFENYRNLLLAEICDPQQEDIQCFIDRCTLMAGHFSSALVQARLRGRDVVYLRDSYLTSLWEYHEYYKRVPSVDLFNLENFVTGKLNRNISADQGTPLTFQ